MGVRVVSRAATVCVVLIFALQSPAWAQHQAASLDPLFTEHVVLQRDVPIPVWGTAPPGSEIEVSLSRATARARADAEGKWNVQLRPLPVGGPHQLQLRSGGEVRETVEDVWLGDVFLCSGQSNMEWPVQMSTQAESAIESSSDSLLRMLKVGLAASSEPRDAFETPVEWRIASPAEVGDWSAVCYFFAREIRRDHGVPVGLINASWGGSDIRAWMSAEALLSVGGYEEDLELLQVHARDPSAAQERFGRRWEAWWRAASGDSEGGEPWRDSSGVGWTHAPEQLGDWKTWGVEALEDHLGMLWHRATFELSDDEVGDDATLSLGGIDEVDQTWVNGVPIGNTFGWGTPRTYRIPARHLRAGTNVVVTNVLNTWGLGGLVGEPESRHIQTGRGTVVPLRDWRWAPVSHEIGMPPRSPWESVAGRTTIFNAMVAPLNGFALRGGLWYQGESNAGDSEGYAVLLRALVEEWRDRFRADLPVLVVQLANYDPVPDMEVESGWAEVRDAQRRVALGDPGVALTVTVDIGDPDDVHPRNKLDVGRRLARAADVLIYGEDKSPSGAVPVGAMRTARGIVVAFDDVTGHLAEASVASHGFELCGPESGSCKRTEAQLEGDRVLLAGDEARRATRVRYCWGNSPVCGLTDGTGLPVTPFELSVK